MANLTDIYNIQGDYETALIYTDSILNFSQRRYDSIFYHLRKTSAYQGLKKWDKALKHIDHTLNLDKKSEDDYGYTLDLLLKGQILKDKKDYQQAFEILKETKTLFNHNKIEDISSELQLNRDYVNLYLKLNNPELAQDFDRFIAVNDSLLRQVANENMAEMNAKYLASEKERHIAEQELKIQKEKTKRNIAIGSGTILSLFIFGFFYIRNNQQKRKQLAIENEVLGLQQNMQALEIRSLNQRLDPHEIKNLLAAISPEIQEKAPDSYRRMIKLLNLTKASLGAKSITENLEIQLLQVEDYLQLENSLNNIPIDYQIKVDANDKQIGLPRMLLKNMVENAVKHGIKKSERPGRILIDIQEDELYLKINIQDNGNGMDPEKTSKKGIGISTYRRLFSILNQTNKLPASMNIQNQNPGTLIEIHIPKKYKWQFAE